jgi:hypothetical protein
MRYHAALLLFALSAACAPSTRIYGSHYMRGQTWEVTNGSRCTAHFSLQGPGGAVIQKYEIPPGAIDWVYISQDNLYLSFTSWGPNEGRCDPKLIRIDLAKGPDKS